MHKHLLQALENIEPDPKVSKFPINEVQKREIRCFLWPQGPLWFPSPKMGLVGEDITLSGSHGRKSSLELQPIGSGAIITSS